MKTEPPVPAPSRPFVIARAFPAPRERVWKMWTEASQLSAWFGPRGFTLPVATLDFRPNGKFHYCMQAPDGARMWGRFVYREIVALERIVWVNSFSDESGGLVRPPFSDTWPREMLSIATFAEEAGGTTVQLVWTAHHATAEEQRTFDASHDSMRQGWTGTFDQLEALLSRHGPP